MNSAVLRVMVLCRPSIGRATYRGGPVKRVVGEREPRCHGLVDGDDLERGPAAVQDNEPTAAPDASDNVRQPRSQFLGIDRLAHQFTTSSLKFILS